MRRRKIIVMVAIALALICCVALAACNSEGVQADRQITITILNGEHYQVVGDNKRVVEKGESAVFTVSLDRGYKIVGAYGDKCEISEEYSFQQTVTFVSVYYKSTVRLETAEMGTSAFVAENDLQGGGSFDFFFVWTSGRRLILRGRRIDVDGKRQQGLSLLVLE